MSLWCVSFLAMCSVCFSVHLGDTRWGHSADRGRSARAPQGPGHAFLPLLLWTRRDQQPGSKVPLTDRASVDLGDSCFWKRDQEDKRKGIGVIFTPNYLVGQKGRAWR